MDTEDKKPVEETTPAPADEKPEEVAEEVDEEVETPKPTRWKKPPCGS